MSAFDPTTEPDDVEQRFRSWMADQRAEVDLTSTYARIIEQTGSSRPRPRFLVRPSLTRTSPPTTWSYRWGRLAPIAIAAVLLGVAIGAVVLVGGRLQQDAPLPQPSPPVPSVPVTAPSPRAVVNDPAIVIERGGTLAADARYTSDLFQPRVTFTATPRTTGGAEGDICLPAATSTRMIVLAHPKGCVADLRFIHPWAVDCGSAGDHPDAAALAAAILAIPATTPAVDLGDTRTRGDLPTGMFREPYPGRVVRMPGSGPSVEDVADADRCALLPEPGTHDPVIEIRRDIGARFVLLDVDGQLVVIRASSDGYDNASHAEAIARGYAAPGDDQLIHLLQLVTDIRFGP